MIRSSSALRLALVQAITLGRATSGIVFASVAMYPPWQGLAIGVFCFGMISDFMDGYLARRWSCATPGGRALDLFGDKVLTLASLLYAVARGVPLLPCALLLIREALIMSLRTVQVHGAPLIPLTGIVGGITLVPIRLLAVLLLAWPQLDRGAAKFITAIAWIGAIMSLLSLGWTLSRRRKALILAFRLDSEELSDLRG